MDLILSFGKLEEAMPGHGSLEVAEKFRGTEPRLEYYVKQVFTEWLVYNSLKNSVYKPYDKDTWIHF